MWWELGWAAYSPGGSVAEHGRVDLGPERHCDRGPGRGGGEAAAARLEEHWVGVEVEEVLLVRTGALSLMSSSSSLGKAVPVPVKVLAERRRKDQGSSGDVARLQLANRPRETV